MGAPVDNEKWDRDAEPHGPPPRKNGDPFKAPSAARPVSPFERPHTRNGVLHRLLRAEDDVERAGQGFEFLRVAGRGLE